MYQGVCIHTYMHAYRHVHTFTFKLKMKILSLEIKLNLVYAHQIIYDNSNDCNFFVKFRQAERKTFSALMSKAHVMAFIKLIRTFNFCGTISLLFHVRSLASPYLELASSEQTKSVYIF